MTHLTSDQFVAELDGELSPAERRHLDACLDCRSQLDGLREVLTLTQSVAIPEPSPLFWEHFSRRVNHATSEVALPARRWWEELLTPMSTIGVALAAMALVFVVRVAPGNHAGAGDTAATLPLAVGTMASSGDDAAGEQPWQLLTEMASDLPRSDAQQLAQPSADAAASMLAQLSPAQRAHLLQLIKAEMDRSE